MSDVMRDLINLVNNCFAQGSHMAARMPYVWDLIQEVQEQASLEEVRAKAIELVERYRLDGRNVYHSGYPMVVHILYPSCD